MGRLGMQGLRAAAIAAAGVAAALLPASAATAGALPSPCALLTSAHAQKELFPGRTVSVETPTSITYRPRSPATSRLEASPSACS